jgi:hypothetical protein
MVASTLPRAIADYVLLWRKKMKIKSERPGSFQSITLMVAADHWAEDLEGRMGQWAPSSGSLGALSGGETPSQDK